MSFCMTAAFAQSGAVKGKVLDELGEPIIGANIVEKGTTNGTITDMDGNYSLTFPIPAVPSRDCHGPFWASQ